MSRALHRGALWCALWLAGCGTEAAAEGSEGERAATPVEVATGRVGELAIEREYLGLVRSVARAELAAGADGEVLEVSVREGDRVEAGQLLLRIDPDLARAALRSARAAQRERSAEEAQASRDARRLEAAGARTVAAVEIERAAARADALAAAGQNVRAEVARARASLERHRVVAPFAGVIAAREVDPGDWVTAGTEVLVLVADDRTEVLVRVEPEILEDLEVGTEGTLLSGRREARARVTGVVRALDAATRSARVRLSPVAAAPWLLAGSAVRVRFELSHGGEGVVVPRDALVAGVAETRVVRVVDGRAEPLAVEVLERGAEEVRVLAEGLGPDDRLVVRGNERLRPGQPVRVAGR